MATLVFRFLLAAALLSAVPVFAQQPTPATQAAPPAALPPTDVIVKLTGDELPVHIVEVTPDMVKYHRADNPQGPLFSVFKRDVFMVRYANGTKDVFGTPAPAPARVPDYNYSPAISTVRTYNKVPITERDSVFDHVQAGGPRIGLTVVGNGKLRDRLRDEFDASNVITQIGWQFEQRLFTLPHGPTGLIEFVPLIGGLEQGLFLPSISGILGLRGQNGLEIGLGPNLSLAGAGMAFAAGQTIKGKYVNVPINFAVVPAREGTRVSFLIGFTYITQNR